MGHGIEERSEGFAVSCFKLLDEVLDVIADELLRARWLPIITVGSRMDGGCAVVAVVAAVVEAADCDEDGDLSSSAASALRFFVGLGLSAKATAANSTRW